MSPKGGGSPEGEHRRLALIIRTEAVLLVVLLVSWSPFVLDLLRVRAG